MKPALWFLRKALYVAAGSALGAGYAYVTGKPDIAAWTIHGVGSALGTALVMDLKHAFLPEWLNPPKP